MNNPAEKSDSQAKTQDQGGAPRSNFDRLLSHLDSDSLAAKLVSAYAEPGQHTRAKALRNVIAGRLHELKESYDDPADQ